MKGTSCLEMFTAHLASSVTKGLNKKTDFTCGKDASSCELHGFASGQWDMLKQNSIFRIMMADILKKGGGASLVAQMIKNLPTMWETWVLFLDWEDLLEEGMATHSSILAWEIPWTEEPGRLQSVESEESDTTERLRTADIKVLPRKLYPLDQFKLVNCENGKVQK